MKDYYGILGISKSVSSAEIKRAYRRLAMQYHPDKNPSPEAEQFFKEINEAYDILGNEENKRWYDFKLQSHSSSDTTIEFTQPAPRHRDPAYRRKRPVSKPRVETESREELLTRYLPYFFWFNQVGVGLMLIFLLDRSLPLSSSKETVLHLYSVVGKGQIDQGMITTHAYNVPINSDLETFREGDEVELSHTPILKVVYEFRHHGRLFTISDHGIYGAVFIFPIGLFISSMLGLLFRKEPEYAFNLSIISAVLFIFVTIFLLTI